MKTIRFGDVVALCIEKAYLAGRKPTRLLIGPEIWPIFVHPFHIVPQLGKSTPVYRGLPCYKMRCRGVAVETTTTP